MSDDVASTLTVAKLKALCILNDLATSGKKSELVKRLLESGLSNEEVGLPPAKETTEPVEAKTTPAEDEEVVLSLEDEDTLTPEVEPVKKTVEAPPEEDEVLEAEILDAEIMLEETPAKQVTKKVVKSLDSDTKPATLLDIVKRPQVAAALMTLILVGAGGYYWVNNQLDPFTADQ